MKEKDILVCKLSFQKPLHSFFLEKCIIADTAYTNITKKKIFCLLISWLAIKPPGPDKINLPIFGIIWDWIKSLISNMIQHAICLDYDPKFYKKELKKYFSKIVGRIILGLFDHT